MNPNEQAIDLKQAITMCQAARLMRGRRGKPPAVDTVRRWANPRKGYGHNGQRTVLMAVKVNGELLTTVEWVEAFERRRATVGAVIDVPLSRSPAKRAAALRRAEKSLDEHGVR